jgi:succinate dehydrogenase/fumarate reductase flavoprotein subunit
MTPQKINNHTIEDLVHSERDESPVAQVRRMMIRMVNELKGAYKNNSMNPKTIKKLKKTQQQLHEQKVSKTSKQYLGSYF